MFFLLLLLSLSTAVVIYVWRFYENTKRYPKGPRPYPVVGNLLSLRLFAHTQRRYEKFQGFMVAHFTVWLPQTIWLSLTTNLSKKRLRKKVRFFSALG
ncbi:hypothetical protein OSTOST_23727 [Ostertagia ostertagi]